MPTIESGYKQTEIGVIPEDWEVQSIIDNSTLKARIGWQGLTTAEYLNSGGFYLVTGTDFKNGKIDWDNCVYVDEERYSQDRNIQLKIGDVLVTKDGTIGKIAYITNLLLPATLNSGVFVIRPKEKAYFPLFLFYVLSSDYFNQFLNKLQAGSTIKHLYQKDFVGFNFIVPEYSEQEKIAQVLSDVYALIEALDRLIEKKKDIKQGALQEILSGKKRLPGKWEEKKAQKSTEVGVIPEDWDVRTFGELFEFLPTGTNARSDLYDQGEINYVHYGDIHAKWKLFLDCEIEKIPFISTEKIRNLPFVEEGDLVIADASEDYAGIGASIEIRNVKNKKIVCGLHTLFLRGNKEKIVDGYKAYLTSISVVKSALISKATGISVYGISKNTVKNTKIPLPTDLK